MDIEVTHHIDSSEADADGNFDYRYEYDLIRLAEGENAFVARSYPTEPREAHFLRFESGGTQSPICEAHLQTALFREAFRFLKSTGKTTVTLLGTHGYEPVAPEI
jgi:hypothetical protein